LQTANKFKTNLKISTANKSITFQNQNISTGKQPFLLTKRRNLIISDSDSEFTPNFENSLSYVPISKGIYSPAKTMILANLSFVLKKMFLNEPLPKDEITLSDCEMSILAAILKKKKVNYYFENNLTITRVCISKIMQKFSNKKREHYLKYILPKCLRHLKAQLNWNSMINEYNYLKLTKLEYEYKFYSFYFGDISEKNNIPLEKFFMFRNWTHRFNSNLPKTVTSEFILLWKKNPTFIRKIKSYLTSSFMEGVKEINSKKLKIMLSKWEMLIESNGLGKGLDLILKTIGKKGSKVPWMTTEIKKGIEMTLDVLR
jgi:hypothetical protein